MDRVLFLLWRLWRRPPSRGALLVIMATLALSIGIVALERVVGWPSWLRVERVPMLRLPHP
ncbi:hypothetical protein D9599_14520 [Roseomonas sp. KE2513]|uniref:hypothetical protein n=1 Tax=Roseomonas sp. KE2513 TaxID=2479202 RepID=UPI0018DF9757|nr:hypothetical protein [Roseomonas sp. KE2513]MBI0536788.1 hypothetical protein [Roseomonas sp. KE2513]